jgi:dihydroxyacetone kinase DhaKLM complex PTS-EIIA-like component DhaM
MPDLIQVPEGEIRDLCSVRYAADKLDLSVQATNKLCDANLIESGYIGPVRKVYKDSLRDYIANLPKVAPAAEEDAA